ncbi:MAG TPA: HlyD family efflux transporter periplasmic adaptor subunit [Anaerolineales bacterium]|nr:HlyD family efflux transporter periplasmic adaptor subunit [Anaerolineales bacterium]
MMSTVKNRAVLALVLLAATGCTAGQGDSTVTASPEADFVSVISATGQVVPIEWASLSLPGSGVIAALPVVEGDRVAEDQILLQLSGREGLEAVLAAAKLEQIQAQQALDEVIDDEELARALAQDAWATARDEVRKAEYDRTVQQEGYRASDDTIDRARANVIVAEDVADEKKDDYDDTPGKSDSARKANALAEYLSAKAALDAARRSLNWYTGHPTEIQQAMLDADVAVAQARLAQAEQDWNDVQAGPDPDVLRLAQARLAQAESAVKAAEAALRDSELRAPFAGTVAAVRVRPNEWTAPGTPLVDLADLRHLQVQTTDLSEIDVARVAVDSPVTITFDALPDVVAQGHVARVSPRASEGSGVNYTIWIALDEAPPGLLWGMTAFVDIEASP